MNRLALLFFLLIAAAGAQELLTPGEQVIRELRAALDKPDDARAAALLFELGEIYRYPASEAEAASLLALAVEAARSKRPRVVVAALEALAETGAPAARTHLEPFLRTVRKGEERIVLAAVRAAGRLRAPSLIPYLLHLGKGSPDLTIADQALRALGAFCKSDAAIRRRVTRETLALCQSLARKRGRWNRLRAPGLRALQRLTARKLNSLQMFSDWWRQAKTRKNPFGTVSG